MVLLFTLLWRKDNFFNCEKVHPADVVGREKPGRLVAILGDSSDSRQMAVLCQNADVLVHEATLENGMKDNAIEKGHSTPGNNRL